MQTAVNRRGQTVVPAAIRRRYHIDETVRLEWLDDGESIGVVPVPSDPIEALRGMGRGEGLTDLLLVERTREPGLSPYS